MTSTTYKRRSINLDDRTYKRGKLLAKSQTVSLSALLRLLINGAYEQFPGLHHSKMAVDLAEYQEKIRTHSSTEVQRR